MKRIIAPLVATLALATPGMSQGQDVCMPGNQMKAALIDWYQERPVPGQAALKEQLWVSDKTGTWTMVTFLADGNACVTAQGSDWQAGIAKDELLAMADR